MRLVTLAVTGLLLSWSALAQGTLFGIELGRPLVDQLPQCANNRPSARGPSCWIESDLPPIEGRRRFDIWFNVTEEPQGMRASSAYEVDGVVQAVIVSTGGEFIQDQLLQDLTKKFGKASSVRRTPMVNNFGVRHVAVDARWTRSGFVVELYGFESDVDYGRLLLMTAAYAGAETQRDQRRAKDRRPL